MLNDNYAIAYACDNNLLQNRLLRLSINSLKKHCNLKPYILTIEKDYKYIKYFSDCNVIVFSDDLLDKYFSNIKATHRPIITKAAFCRLFIPLLLKQYSKVLYLDCDTKIQNDLSDVFKYSQHEIYGKLEDEVYDPQAYYIKSGVKALNSLDKYVNSGVLLFNNDIILKKHNNYIRHLDYMFKLQNVFNFFHKDQDLINICFDVAVFDKPYIYSVNNKNDLTAPKQYGHQESAYILHFNQLNKQEIVQQATDELCF